VRRKFNVVIFRKILNNSLDESKGFETVLYTRWRGVTNFRSMFSYLDRNAPDWWYINVYERLGKSNDTIYVGRIYTDTRLYSLFA
jgi:hypothetical protein